KFETRFQLVWVIGGIFAIIPFAEQIGLFLLAIVLGFAAVSYVAALRAARGRVMRTKLLPEAVDRTISRSREQAVDRVKRRFRRPARPTGDPPAAEPEAGTGPLRRSRPAPCRRAPPASGSSRPSACRPARGWRSLRRRNGSPPGSSLRRRDLR